MKQSAAKNEKGTQPKTGKLLISREMSRQLMNPITKADLAD